MKELSAAGVFTLLLCSSLTIMAGTVLAPSLNEIAVHLGFSANPGWLITLPSLGVVVSAPLIGRLIDSKGPYTVLCWGLGPYALLGAAGAFFHNPYLAAADRFLLGTATAAVQAAGTGLIALFFSGRRRIQILAWQGMSIELGGVVFLTAGGLLGEFGWQFPFCIYLTGFLCLLLVISFIAAPESQKVVHSNGAVPEPVSAEIKLIIFFAALSMILFFTAFLGLPQLLPENFNFTESQTGIFMGLISLLAVAAAGLMPQVLRYISEGMMLALGFGGFMAGLALFGLAVNLPALVLGAAAMGTGFGFTVPLLNHMAVEYSSNLNRGRNLGLFSMGIFGGQFLSSFIEMVSDDIKIVFLTGAALALAASFTAWTSMPARKRYNRSQ